MISLHCQVKIQGQNKEMLATACQMFMGKSEGEIANIAHLTVEVGVLITAGTKNKRKR